ncbi:hypothetical protein COV15_01885 [Candidatus Woesearchaeota archaeon CG10_big_fil_rev_8_21_14_0_10_34_12]|nr:MAG: hypothetical protein COV15_01885 [Candidatus Woesearchaeota archaeon CG10_big_fil_rev_8_21_14_0_10_34_12]
MEKFDKEFLEKLEVLKKEQEKLAKQVSVKDSIDFENAERIAGCHNIMFGKNVISAFVTMGGDEELEKQYFMDRLRFPYVPGFRAYRELPAMMEAFAKLEEKPELVIVSGNGLTHERLGLASHFSILADVPCIGIADKLIAGELKDRKIILNGKIIGGVIVAKPESRPLYVSPGSGISVETSLEIIKKLIRFPHKLPEPLHKATRYSKEIMKEIGER